MLTPDALAEKLRGMLPAELHAAVPRLAALIASAAEGAPVAEELRLELARDATLAPLLARLAGQRLRVNGVELRFDAVQHTSPGGVAELSGDTISVGAINASASAIAIGRGATAFSLHLSLHGTGLGLSQTPVPRRLFPRPLPQPRLFWGRAAPQRLLAAELRPRGGAFISGPLGCGATTLLRQVAGSEAALALRDGTVFLDGSFEPDQPDDLTQALYNRFFADASGATLVLPRESRASELSSLQALVVLDRLRIDSRELDRLAQTLQASGAVLVAAEDLGSDALLPVELEPLAPADALALFAAQAGSAYSDADSELAGRLCETLGGLPLGLVLAARLVAAGTPLAELAATAAGLPEEAEPLARAVRLTLGRLDEADLAMLAAVVHALPGPAELAALAETSALPATEAAPRLKRLVRYALLVKENSQCYRLANESLRCVLAPLLEEGETRTLAVGYFARTAQAFAGDPGWLASQAQNLLATAREALQLGQPAEAGRLLRAAQPELVARAYWAGWNELAEQALLAAEQTGDAALRAWALHERGTHAGLEGELAAARADLELAEQLRLSLGDLPGAALSRNNLQVLGLAPPPPDGGQTDVKRVDVLLRRRPRLAFGGLGSVLLLTLLAPVLLLVALLNINVAPRARASATPLEGPAPLDVTLDASGSGDWNFTQSLTYIWEPGDGSPAIETQEPRVRHLFRSSGAYEVVLRVRDSQGAESMAPPLRIQVTNAPPRVTISGQPPDADLRAGQPIVLSGAAVDPQDGAVPAEGLRWTLTLVDGEQRQILAEQQGERFEFELPALDPLAAQEPWLAVRLVASDSEGLVGEALAELRPTLERVALTSEPPGLRLEVDGLAQPTPLRATFWPGAQLTVLASSQQDAAGTSWGFAGWQDEVAENRRVLTAGGEYQALFVRSSLSFVESSLRAAEVDEVVEVQIRVDPPPTQDLLLRYSVDSADSSATEGQDYQLPDQRLVRIGAGQSTGTIPIRLFVDGIDEPDERLRIEVRSEQGGVEGAATLVIEDSDPAPAVEIVAPEELEEGQQAQITLRLSGPSSREIRVPFSLGGNATLGDDYSYLAPEGDVLVFAPLTTEQAITLVVNEDGLDEAAEQVSFSFGAAQDSGFAGQELVVRLIDADVPAVGFSAARYEGAENTGPVEIVLVLDQPAAEPLTVRLSVSGGLATPGADFDDPSGELTFAVGQQSQSIQIEIVNDAIYEQTESFELQLDAPAVQEGAAQATVAILDDEPAPLVTFGTWPATVQVSEGVGTLNVPLILSAESQLAVPARLEAVAGQSQNGARPGEDFVALDTSIAVGPEGASVSLQILQDRLYEGEQSFALRLFGADGTFLEARTITILDDDLPEVNFEPLPLVDEGSRQNRTVTFSARLKNAEPNNAAAYAEVRLFVYSPLGTSATAGQDYLPISDGPVNIFPGREPDPPMQVTIFGDTLYEGAQDFQVELRSPDGQTLASQIVVIIDDDVPQVRLEPARAITVDEGDEEFFYVEFRASLTNAETWADLPLYVYTPPGFTATPDDDYGAIPGSLVRLFPASQQVQVLQITVYGDDAVEADETFRVEIRTPDGQTRLAATTVTIRNDDSDLQ
jgi:PKD repeat protein